MNFDDVNSLEEAEFVAGPPRLITDEDRRRHRLVQRRLTIAEADERAIAAWKREFSDDVQAEIKFYAAKRANRSAKRADRHRRKAFIKAQMEGPCTISDDDPRWDDLWTRSDDTTSDGEE